MKLQKISPILAGLIQALLVTGYCVLIARYFYFMNQNFNSPPMVLGIMLMLMILVFSAAIMGVIVFGYPVYLLFEKKFKKALQVVGYTLLFTSVFIAILIYYLIQVVI